LTATVTVGGGAATTELEFEPLEEAGTYNAAFIPTLPGDYTFVISGTLDGTEIDETFESGPNTFEPVEDPAELQFPQPSTDASDSASDSSSDDDDNSTVALIIGVIAIVAAAVAIILGLIAFARKASG
jgi:hypothetical protein